MTDRINFLRMLSGVDVAITFVGRMLLFFFAAKADERWEFQSAR